MCFLAAAIFAAILLSIGKNTFQILTLLTSVDRNCDWSYVQREQCTVDVRLVKMELRFQV